MHSNELESKFNSLGKRESITKVDSASRSSHVLLPRVRTTFTTTTSSLFTSEGTSDFSSRSTDVDVDYTTVRAVGADPLEDVLHVQSEDRAAEALRDGVVEFNGFFKVLDLDDVEDGAEEFLLDNRSSSLVNFDDGGKNKVTAKLVVLEGGTTSQDLASLLLDFLDSFQVLSNRFLSV